MKILKYCNKVIEYSFYLLFFLVPLALTGDTSELFEFNKLWATFIITIIIGGAWFTKMVIQRKAHIQRTPLDIPIALFLISEVISTFMSLDPHTSLWGYYSRFNGGLLSILAFVFLFYAFVSNLITKEDEKEEKEHAYDYKKGVLYFLSAVAVFAVGVAVAAALKPTTEAGIPMQMLVTLITTIASFAVFMKAAPLGILKKSLYAIFTSAFMVIAWGIPSHFGYDPTCLLFRGTLDVSCWTTDFYPKVRMFSTLGQPDWLAAYLGILIPIITAIYLNFLKGKDILNEKNVLNKNFLINLAFLIFYIALYAAFLFTGSRTAIAALWLSLGLLFIFYFWYFLKPKLSNKTKPAGLKVLVVLLLSTVVITFFAGLPAGFPFTQISKFTWNQLSTSLNKPKATQQVATKPQPTPTPAAFSTGELGGTDSSKIRSYVWKGAINIWKANPVFGTGVETYAFAYYMYRPEGHNMTSEWNYLYNKAHNEFLNYLATTGTVGIITYLLMIGVFYYLSFKYLYKKRKTMGPSELLVASFIAGYTVINITNFGGFSVVIVNIFFYLFPAFVLALAKLIDFDKSLDLRLGQEGHDSLGGKQKAATIVIMLIGAYMIYSLINYWNADRYYYYGYNYDRTGDYQKAYTFLKQAVDTRPGEPVFQDEFAYNNAILGASLLAQSQSQKDATNQQQNVQISKQLIDTAVAIENKVTTEHPNNVVFWKTKVRMLYTLSQLDPQTYLPSTLDALKKAQELAPTDPDVSYNLGVLYGQTGDFNKAIQTLQNTIKLKPDYKSGQAYYALAIFYHQIALDQSGKVVNKDYNQKAIDELQYMLKYFGPNQQASDALKAWQ